MNNERRKMTKNVWSLTSSTNYFIHLTLVPTVEDWAENSSSLATTGLESKTIAVGD